MNPKNCCVDSCTSSSIREQDKGVTFHRLPKNPTLKSKWIRQARVNLEDNKNKWNYICSRHFRKIDFEAYKASKFALKLDAIPTIFPWGITPLEDLIKIFPADDSCNLSSIRHSSESEIKSDGETKSCSSKDSEEDNKSESEIPAGSSMEKGEDLGDSADIEYEVEDEEDKPGELVVYPDKDETTIDDVETSTMEDQSACSMSTESASEVVEEEIVPVIVCPVKKKRGRRSNQEILLAKLAADQERALLDKERGMEEVPALPEKRIKFPGRKSLFDLDTEPKVTAGAKRGPKPKGRRTLTPKSTKKQTNLKQESFEVANDPDLFPDLMIDESIPGGNLKVKPSTPTSFIKEEMLAKFESANGGLIPDSARELVPLKAEKFSSSPMLKALIEKKTPMTKSKPTLPSFMQASGSDGDSKAYESPKYSMSEKGASGGAEKGVMVPGARVEAKDFSEQWYAARIMEVDHEELEVLIHYDNWSQRYDEWISMSSPRLRVLDPPCGPPAAPSYGEGERCLARWSDNRRFAATVQKVLPDGKYQVKFDDGFIRTLKWANLAKADTISPLNSASVTTTPSSMHVTPLTPLTPIPYRAKMPAPTLPAAPTSLPPPVHNHLFDPSRDHLGSKEERRDMKRKLVVKDLFQKDNKHAGRIKVEPDKRLKKFRRRAPPKVKSELVSTPETIPASSLTAQPENLNSFSTDLSQLMAKEWSCHWLDGQPVGIAAPLPAERGDRGGRPALTGGPEEAKPRLERMSVQVQDHRLPEGWSKFLTRRCVGNSMGKWDVVLVCPTGRRYRSRIEVRAHLSEPDGAGLEAYAHCLQDFSVHRKLARRLGWDHTSSPKPGNPAIAGMTATAPKRTNSPANRIRKRIASPALKKESASPGLKIKIKKELDSPLGSPKHKAELICSPLVKMNKEQERVASPVMKVGRVASPALKMNEQARVSSPAFKIKTDGAPIKAESPQQMEEIPIPAAIPPAVPEVPPPPAQPPLEDGFIYVGSLKVQVIDNLLRCPKEGCFKNFRKVNFLQMHIKHYHSDLLSFLGETLNVADLAYARTITEDVAPVKPATDKPHKPKERRSIPIANVTPKVEPIPVIKEEIVHLPAKCLSPEPTASLKPYSTLEVLDKSPKLRTLLESKPEIKIEAKQDNEDLDDYMTAFKIKSDIHIIAPDVTTPRPAKSETLKRLLKRQPEKEITKSRVKSIISKIAAEQGERSRSQSPNTTKSLPSVEFKTEDTEPIVPKLETNMFPTPHKSKKKSKKRHSENVDFRPIKKKKPMQNLDIWTAFTDEMDETRSSFGSPDMMAAQAAVATPATPVVDTAMCVPMEVKEEMNSNTFVTDTGEKIKIVHMKREEIINCHCGFGEEDGLMIQCELCLCWQHALCHNIEKESDVPDKYVCRICLHPPRGRRSQRHLNNQDWLYEGRLARCDLPALDSAADLRRAAALRRSHQLAGNLLHAASLLNSLRCKIEVSQKKDHPKLYLWSKPWDVDSRTDEFIPKPEENVNDHIVKLENQAFHAESHIEYPTSDPYSDISIDQVKLEEVGEALEVSEVNDIEDMDDGVPKCDNEVELCTSEPLGSGAHDSRGVQLLSSMLSSPGGTPLNLPITKSDLDNMVKTVQVSAPQPEAAIEPGECRMRLLQHVERTQALLDARLDSIEAHIAELESQDPSLADDESPEHFPRTKQTIQMLLRDLNTMEELGMITN